MKRLVVGAAVVTALLVLAAVALSGREDEKAVVGPGGSPYRGSEPPGTIHLPQFALRDYTGETVRSSDLLGRVALVTFLDSQCEESCPIVASQVARTIDTLRSGERTRVVAVAISTDPKEDTPASVERFLRRQRAVGRLRFLSAPELQMRPLWKAFQILASAESGDDEVHSAPVRVYDRRGVWVSTLHVGADLTVSNLAHDIRVALRAEATTDG